MLKGIIIKSENTISLCIISDNKICTNDRYTDGTNVYKAWNVENNNTTCWPNGKNNPSEYNKIESLFNLSLS